VALSWMPWIFLSVAILFEVAGITSMKLSRGFAELLPSIGVFVFYICSAAAVILALRRFGAVGHLCHLVRRRHRAHRDDRLCLFPRALHLVKLASLGLVVAGVVGLSLAGKTID